MRAVAEARSNIALVKYWGKRSGSLNLPAVGSLSLTLDGLSTRTEVRFDKALAIDTLDLNGASETGLPRDKVSKFLDIVRAEAGITTRAAVISANSFPTAAGLASSASAFAALALAATKAAGLSLDGKALSILARRGSGSAARSLFGGFVRMHKGTQADGLDSFAEPIAGRTAEDMGVRMVLAITRKGQKETLSTDGMRHTAETSPFFAAWVASSEPDLADATAAITRGDLEALGVVTERSALTMHASALAARPAVLYFAGATIEGYKAVVAMRKAGVPAWFTCDAGPHCKALTDGTHAYEVARRLAEVPGVLETRICTPGRAAEVIESSLIAVRAPGKAIVCGEYAVLDGAPAISVAVDRSVVAREGRGAGSPFVEAALRHAAAALHAAPLDDVVVDSSTLYDSAGKIGVGSSAAVTVAVVGLAFAKAGRSLTDSAQLFAIADAAHAEAQGMKGSGIDVATSVYGGAIEFARTDGPPNIRAVDWPSALSLTFVFSGQSASTPDLVGRVKRLRERDAALYAQRMGALAKIAHAFSAALERGDAHGAVHVIAEWQPALAALGHAADAPIVTPFFDDVAAIAKEHGAAAKPSGAGGGDLGVVLSLGDCTTTLRHALERRGVRTLSLVPHGPARGLSLETHS